MRKVLWFIVASVCVAGCAGRQGLVVHQWRNEQVAPMYLETFLDEHPLPQGESLRVDEIERTATASYHIVQIRGRERPHVHQHHDVMALLLSGSGRLYLGTTVLVLREGAVVTIPRNVAHYFVCDQPDQVAVAYAVFTPTLDDADVVYTDTVSSGAGSWRQFPSAASASVMSRKDEATLAAAR